MNLNSKRALIIFVISLQAPSALWAKTYKASFPTNFEETWRAALISLASYPLNKNNQSTGEIETSLIKEGQIWSPVDRSIGHRNKYKLNLNIRALNKSSSFVDISKDLYKQGNFIEEDKDLESQGVEEQVILYRIKRELIIERKIQKLFK